MQVEFFFDFSCPYAYLGSTQIEALAASCGADLAWKPMLLGGVFRAVGTAQNMGAGMHPSKARHNLDDMHRWAALWDVPFRLPDSHPMRTVAALRALISIADKACWPAVIHSIYHTYWVRGEDIAEREVLGRALERADLPATVITAALEANSDPRIKADLAARTDEAIERGVFGAPAMFAAGELFWGQDRLGDLAHALGGSFGATPTAQPRTGARTIDFYYDFSSPFAYLASRQIEGLAKSAGAVLRYRPFLLGALFKSLGTPGVPILAFSEAKQRYYRRDLHRSAERLEVPLAWNPTFPVRTVNALRLVLAAGDEHIAALTAALFRAVWVDGSALEDAEIAAIATAVGVESDRIDSIGSPAAKAALFEATSEAEKRGVFGAPTLIVSGPGQRDALFWGSDRLELVGHAARGWDPALPPNLPKQRKQSEQSEQSEQR